MTESVANVQIAAGAFVGYAIIGTAAPTLPASGAWVSEPAAGWHDVGYVTDDGITSTRSRETETFGAWQTSSPIANVLTALTDVFGFSIREWNPFSLELLYGRGAGSAAKAWEPSKGVPPSLSMLFQWDWAGYASQIHIPRGSVQGDSETVLARTAPSDLPIEFLSTPSASESIFLFQTNHPAFGSAPGPLLVEAQTTGKAGSEAA